MSQEEILNLIKLHPGIWQSEIVKQFGKSKSCIQLKLLRKKKLIYRKHEKRKWRYYEAP